ncbi:hypothetical protein BGZ54_002472, partial [Gamsiella multidivaricata]
MNPENAPLPAEKDPAPPQEKVSDNSENKPTVAEASATSIQHAELSSSATASGVEYRKVVSDELFDIKKILQQVFQRVERLGTSMRDTEVVASEGTLTEPTRRSSLDLPSPIRERNNRGSTRSAGPRGRRYARPFSSRKPNWTLKVLDPHGLEPVESLDKIEIKESTLKCLKEDGITEAGYIEKNILEKLSAGHDAILQIRGDKLEKLSIYPLVDLFEKAAPELQVLILMSRLDAMSSKSFLTSFQKYLDIADLKVAIHVVPQELSLDLGPLSKLTPNKPTVFVTTPKMMRRLRAENIIKPMFVQGMVVYEAEYVLRTPAHVDMIQSALNDFQICQVVLSTHDGTEDVVRAAEAFDFSEDAIVFSMDRIHIDNSKHFYYTDNALTEIALNHAVKVSKLKMAVVICHDQTEANKLRDEFAERTDAYTIAKMAESTELVGGLLFTSQVISSVFHSRLHNTVGMIMNLSGAYPFPGRYLE